MGVGKTELEKNYYYDELITMLDIYAYANASEEEKKRYEMHGVKYKMLNGEPMTREEARMGSIFSPSR